jgi:hypothetical protein
VNHLQWAASGLSYWRDGAAEVDSFVTRGDSVWAIEVQSGRGSRVSGLAAFRRRYPEVQRWIVGSTGVPLEEIVSADPERWFR